MAETYEHQPGQLDFQIVTKDVSVTEFRRKPSAVWAYLKTPGHVIFFTAGANATARSCLSRHTPA